eukprot:4243038-Heterocapsa_arctica.AAC.1
MQALASRSLVPKGTFEASFEASSPPPSRELMTRVRQPSWLAELGAKSKTGVLMAPCQTNSYNIAFL